MFEHQFYFFGINSTIIISAKNNPNLLKNIVVANRIAHPPALFVKHIESDTKLTQTKPAGLVAVNQRKIELGREQCRMVEKAPINKDIPMVSKELRIRSFLSLLLL